MGEDPDEALAHFAAVRAELGATGPVARHLAETAAASILRSSRADRLEGELLAGLAEGGRSIVEALHADRDARATLALFQRYHHEADGEVRPTRTDLEVYPTRKSGILVQSFPLLAGGEAVVGIVEDRANRAGRTA